MPSSKPKTSPKKASSPAKGAAAKKTSAASKPSKAGKAPAKTAPKATPKAKTKASPKGTSKSAPKEKSKSAPKSTAKPSAKSKVSPAKATPAKSTKKAVATKPTVEKIVTPPKPKPPVLKNTPAFLAKQKQRLLRLKDELLDSMNGVAKDTLRSRAEGSEGSAFGMHQADAGSDAYDRDFALSLLSLEQNSLYEIDQALERLQDGSYGVCEISGKPIPHPRLEALPFTRYTVECQAELEKQNRFRARVPVNSLFGLNDGDGDDDEEDSSSDQKD